MGVVLEVQNTYPATSGTLQDLRHILCATSYRYGHMIGNVLREKGGVCECANAHTVIEVVSLMPYLCG